MKTNNLDIAGVRELAGLGDEARVAWEVHIAAGSLCLGRVVVNMEPLVELRNPADRKAAAGRIL